MEQAFPFNFVYCTGWCERPGNKASTLSYCFKDKFRGILTHSGLCKYKHILVYLLWCCLAIKNLTVNNWAVIAQLCLGNLVCCLAPFNKHACVWGMYVNLEYCSTLHLAMYSSGVGNVHFTWWHENCLCCLSTVVAVVAWTINFTSAIQKWFFNLFYHSFSTMKLVDSFLLKVLRSNLSAGC